MSGLVNREAFVRELTIDRRILTRERERLKERLERVQADLTRNWQLYQQYCDSDTRPEDRDAQQGSARE